MSIYPDGNHIPDELETPGYKEAMDREKMHQSDAKFGIDYYRKSNDLPYVTTVHRDDMAKLAGCVGEILDTVIPGWNEDASTEDTPQRFIKYLAEFCQPIDLDSIFKTFEVTEGHHSMVVQTAIPFRMVCEHHLLPAIGKAAVGYVPSKKVIGLSKLCRLVDAVGVERPSLQEKIADRIVELLRQHLSPSGIMVIIQAEHGCMACRGVTKPDVSTITSNVYGIFRDNAVARQELLSLVQRSLK